MVNRKQSNIAFDVLSGCISKLKADRDALLEVARELVSVKRAGVGRALVEKAKAAIIKAESES